MLPIQHIQALLRACQSDNGRRPASKAAQALADSLGFGRIVGKQWLVSDHDRERIRVYLQQVEGIDPATPPDAWSERTRIGAAELGRNEKLAGRRPREDRLALRGPTGLRLGETLLPLPGQAFLDIPLADAACLRYDCAVVVENFEAFIHYENAAIELPFPQPLIIFRGDSVNTTDTVLKFLHAGKAPVIAWPDMDAAGLLYASSLPRLAGIIGPKKPQECLSFYGRDDLYLGQLRELDALHLSGKSIALEDSVRKNRKGLDQERMISAAIPLILWTT
ncbi:MAG: hypothetical protein A2063_07030 [Gallionellales bacterium GWA2_60_142]|nr:MAG: hypothetical protein A2063_07030 [Gallionellales bacterium GWA2_60_142]HCI14733.1 hypothetical protein [Gallionellaceae bacterium]